MPDDLALYERDDDAFVGMPCTKAYWYPNGQTGGAVLALLGHVLEDVPTLVPMSLSRLTVDIVRPVPVGERLWIDTLVVREGKRLQVVDLVLRTGTDEYTRARALRVRDADLDAMPGVVTPDSTTEDDPARRLPSPESLTGDHHRRGVSDFARYAIDMRGAETTDGQPGVWVRLLVPVVAGEPVRITSRIALPMDCVNLIGLDGVSGLPPKVSAINPDVSAHVARPPVGEWTALVGNTRFANGVGHGMSMATMSDAAGVYGLTSTSQIVQPTE